MNKEERIHTIYKMLLNKTFYYRWQEYSCRGKYTTLEKIPTWREEWTALQQQPKAVKPLDEATAR
jgi:hypothetical protein